LQSYGPGSTEPSAARGPCTSARGIINTTTRCSASPRGVNATANACTGARGRYDEATSTSTSTSGGHNEAASTGARTGARTGGNIAPTTARHAADAAGAPDAIDGRLLGNG